MKILEWFFCGVAVVCWSLILILYLILAIPFVIIEFVCGEYKKLHKLIKLTPIMAIFLMGCIGPSVDRDYNLTIFLSGEGNTVVIETKAEVPQVYTTEGKVDAQPTIDLPGLP